MPTLAEIYRVLQEHEATEKTAAVKKQAIASPQRGSGAPAAEVGATLEDVLGSNIAETKVRIKKKLEEVAGGQKAVEGLTAHPEEAPGQAQAPINEDKMPPGGDKGTSIPAGIGGKLSALLNKGEEKAAKHDDKGGKKGLPPAFLKHKKAEEEPAAEEKTAEEKFAEECFAAGQIQAQGFVYELNRLMAGDEKK